MQGIDRKIDETGNESQQKEIDGKENEIIESQEIHLNIGGRGFGDFSSPSILLSSHGFYLEQITLLMLGPTVKDYPILNGFYRDSIRLRHLLC